MEQQFNMKEDYELQKIVTSVRQFDESYKEVSVVDVAVIKQGPSGWCSGYHIGA